MPAPMDSAPGTIVRSFKSSNGRPSLPTRRWRVEDGPAALELDRERRQSPAGGRSRRAAPARGRGPAGGSWRTSVRAHRDADSLPASVLRHARRRGRHALLRIRAPVRGARAQRADGNRRGGDRTVEGIEVVGVRRRLLRLCRRHRGLLPAPHAGLRALRAGGHARGAPRPAARTSSTRRRRRSRIALPALAAAFALARAARLRGARPVARGADPDGRAAQPAGPPARPRRSSASSTAAARA